MTTREEFVASLPESTQRISFSSLRAYLQCGEKYRLEHVEHVPRRPLGSGLAGSAVHEVIADHLIGDGIFIDADAVEHDGAIAFIERFTAKVEEAGGPDACYWGGRKRNLKDDSGKDVKDEDGKPIKVGEDFRWFCQMGPTFIKRAGAILRRDHERGFTILEASTEIGVSTWLDREGGTLVHGMIDVTVINDDEDEPRIRDWKTGTFLDPFQLAMYGWLWERVFGGHISYGEFAYLRGAGPDTWLKLYDLEPMYPTLEEMIRRTLPAIDAGIFQLQPSSFCTSCSVKDACLHGRTLDG